MYLTHALHRSIFGSDIWNVRETNTVFFGLLFYFTYVLLQINVTCNPIVTIFWNFTIFLRRSDSPKVKRNLMSRV